MAQSGWRLPGDLLRRVRVRAAETGEKQNVFVERALESALGEVPGMAEVPPAAGEAGAPSRASVQRAVAGLMASPEMGRAVKAAAASKSYSCPKPNCIYASPEPGVCVHHRTERLR